MDYYKLKVLNNKRKIIIGLIILVIVFGGIIYFIYYSNNEEEIVLEPFNEKLENDNENINNLIYVDIKGCINKPGVYSFDKSENARINDLILKADGLTDDADTSLVNLSKKLEDEMTVIIYSQNEINEFISVKDELEHKLDLCEIKLKNNACIEAKKESNLVNINEATKEELMTITGIGESKANAIIEYRKEKKFTSIDDIKNVTGIGENLFESIKEYLTI